MSLRLLSELNDAAATVRRAAEAAQNRPDAQAAIQQLVSHLYRLECAAQQDMATRSRRPVPAVDPTQVGGWADSIRQSQAVALAIQLPTNDAIYDAARQLKEAAADVLSQITARAPAVNSPLSGPTPVVTPQAVAPAKLSQRTLGVLAGLGGMLLTGGAGYLAHRYEKRLQADGLELDPDATPEAIRSRTQRLLDDELPGTRISLTPSVDGDWIGSVRRGQETVSRVSARKPQTAAADAARRAMEYDDLRKTPVEMEYLGRAEQAKDVTPKKKAEKRAEG